MAGKGLLELRTPVPLLVGAVFDKVPPTLHALTLLVHALLNRGEEAESMRLELAEIFSSQLSHAILVP